MNPDSSLQAGHDIDPPSAPTEAPAAAVTDTGRRVFRMAVLALCYLVLEIVGKLLVVVQLGFVLWRRVPESRCRRFAAAYSAWMGALWAFVTFASDEAPWPFAPWPNTPR